MTHISLMSYYGTEDYCFDNTAQPWFYHQLNPTTQDDIEARLCAHGPFSDRSTLIDQFFAC